jgi:hypothetical protein
MGHVHHVVRLFTLTAVESTFRFIATVTKHNAIFCVTACHLTTRFVADDINLHATEQFSEATVYALFFLPDIAYFDVHILDYDNFFILSYVHLYSRV